MNSDFGKKYFSSGSYDNYKKEADRWAPIVARKINKIIGGNPVEILDVGCAHGYLIAELQNKFGHSVEGVDFSPYAVKSSEKSVRNKIRRGNILKLPFRKNEFDALICLDVINYLEEDEIPKAIQNLARISKEHIFFGAIFKHSWTASQRWNPDEFRKSALTKKEYVKLFKKYGAKLAGSFDGENGGALLIFKKLNQK